MLSRVIALLFALVLASSGFAMQAPALAIATSSASPLDAGVAGETAPCEQDRSADERPLDDPAGQAQSEGAMDPPALVMARPDAKTPLLTMSRPRPYAVAAWRAPYLDAPQRPPCAAPVNA
ncbi:MAG: hypothetical protein V4569_17050 [Pseudomonadota bacterium]